MTPKQTDMDRIDNIIRRLFAARDSVPEVRATIDDHIADALETHGGRGSGIRPAEDDDEPMIGWRCDCGQSFADEQVALLHRDGAQHARIVQTKINHQTAGIDHSDPTGARAGRISYLQQRHRWMNEALTGVEKAIDHMLRTAERCMAAPRQPGDDGIDYTRVKPDTCPNMVMRTLTIHGEHSVKQSERLERCGQITRGKLDEHGNAIGADPDGYCVDCRALADAAMAEAVADLEAERRARHAASARKSRRVP